MGTFNEIKIELKLNEMDYALCMCDEINSKADFI